MIDDWNLVIGIEIHAQVKSNSKLFSSSLVSARTVSESSKFASLRISSSNASPFITIEEDNSLAISNHPQL